jgi:hypothetical protein
MKTFTTDDLKTYILERKEDAVAKRTRLMDRVRYHLDANDILEAMNLLTEIRTIDASMRALEFAHFSLTGGE